MIKNINNKFKTTLNRRVLFEKTLPSYKIVEQMIEDILSGFKIYKRYENMYQYEVYFFIKNEIVILCFLKGENNDRYCIHFNPNVLYYDLNCQPYKYKINIRKSVMDIFNIEHSNENITFDSTFNIFVKNDCFQI